MKRKSSDDRKLQPINSLFDKYKKTLKAPQGVVVEAFCEVVEDLFAITIPKDRVSYTPHTKTLSVAISGALKSEIKMRQEEILTHLKGRLGAQSAPKVIL